MKTGRDVVVAALLGRRGVRFRHRAAGGRRLHHDAQVPPQHLPGGHRHAGPELRKTIRRQARARRQLLLLRRRGSARDHGAAGLPHGRRNDRPRRPARHAAGRSSTGRPTGSTSRAIFHQPQMPAGVPRLQCEKQDHGLAKALDHKLIERCRAGARRGETVSSSMPVRNINRTVGTMLSREVARRYGQAGLPDDTIHVQLQGTAGQSFGAFLAHGVTLDLAATPTTTPARGCPAARSSCARPTTSAASSPSKHHRRQRRAVRRHRRRGLSSAALPASASACATRAPSPSSRASATTAANT